MDKQNEQNSEYFAKMFTGHKDKLAESMKISFSLYLSIATFEIIYHHLLDSITNPEKKEFIESLPDFVVNKWLKDQQEAINAEIEDYKKQSSTMMGQIFGSVIGDPEKIKSTYELRVKAFAESIRQMLKNGKIT